jgi:hypothetical protein
MELEDIKQSRWLLPVMAGALLLVVVLLVTLFTGGEGTARILTRSVPDDLVLTMDGKQIDANGETVIKPGSHTLVAKRSGFADETQTFTIEKDQTYNVTFFLDDNGPEGREWYDRHPNEELEKEAEKGKEFEENGKKLKAKYPILEKLPFLGPGFEINYGQSRQHPDDPLTIALYIKVIYPAGKQIAIDWLKSNGVEPGTIEIIWTS